MSRNLEVKITVAAQKDIICIFDYISSDNDLVAKNIIDIFYETFELLSCYPETGSQKSDIKDKAIRIYTIKKSFCIVYRIMNNKIEILRILTRYQNILAILN